MKYEFTGETQEFNGIILKRIRRIKDEVIGGWIEAEKNLSQVSGNAWVSSNARVYGNAQVSGNAWVYGDAQVSGDAWVYGDAWVSGNAQVSGPLDFVFVSGVRWSVTASNDGNASFGCKTKPIMEWLAMTFDSQKKEFGPEAIQSEDEFMETKSILEPIFVLMLAKSELRKQKGELSND